MSSISIVTIKGWVATAPKEYQTKSGRKVARFRVAVTPRRYDKLLQTWQDGRTEWFTVLVYRESLERNVLDCVHKGHPLVITGRLSTYDWEHPDGTKETGMQVVADTIGHDYNWGHASFVRTGKATIDDSGEPEQSEIDPVAPEPELTELVDKGADFLPDVSDLPEISIHSLSDARVPVAVGAGPADIPTPF